MRELKEKEAQVPSLRYHKGGSGKCKSDRLVGPGSEPDELIRSADELVIALLRFWRGSCAWC